MKPGDELILTIKDGDSAKVAAMLERNNARLERAKGESSLTALSRWVEAHGVADHHYQAVRIMAGPVMMVESVRRDVRAFSINTVMGQKALLEKGKSSRDTVLERAKRLIAKGWEERTKK